MPQAVKATCTSPRAVETEAGLAAPQIRNAMKRSATVNGISFSEIEWCEMPRRKIKAFRQ